MSALLTWVYREYCSACLAEIKTGSPGRLKMAEQRHPLVGA